MGQRTTSTQGEQKDICKLLTRSDRKCGVHLPFVKALLLVYFVVFIVCERPLGKKAKSKPFNLFLACFVSY